jgi:hypothetical protein
MQCTFLLGWSCFAIPSSTDVMRWETGIERQSGGQASAIENAEAHHKVEWWDDSQERGWDISLTHGMPHGERLPSIYMDGSVLTAANSRSLDGTRFLRVSVQPHRACIVAFKRSAPSPTPRAVPQQVE